MHNPSDYDRCPDCGRFKQIVYRLCEECFVKKQKEGTEYPDGNPKAAAAHGKPTIHAIPFSAIEEEGYAMLDGHQKYGLVNWRKDGQHVSASTYIDALFRHVKSWWEGEQRSTDTKHIRPDGVHHLGHARACLAILIDAERTDTLIDDRPGNPKAIGTKPGDLK